MFPARCPGGGSISRGAVLNMKSLKNVLVVVVAALLAFTSTAPVTAREYNEETHMWSDQVAGGGGKKGSSIKKEVVEYATKYKPGTIVVETSERRLYLVLPDGKAMKYGIGVGRDGFRWSGQHRITRTAEWPGWTPPAAMRKRVPDLPAYMPGGPNNPLGARALYIGSTLYRIHGTSEPWTIGQAVSSGCIRLTNDDITDLYERVKVGALVVVNQ